MSKLTVESNVFINEKLHLINSISSTIKDLNDKSRFNFVISNSDDKFEFDIIVEFNKDEENKDTRISWNVDGETSTIRITVYNSELLGGVACKTFGELMYITTIDDKKLYAEIQIDTFSGPVARIIMINLYEEI